MATQVYANEQLQVSFCFNPLISVVQFWNYTKTIILLRLSEYYTLKVSVYPKIHNFVKF